LGVNRQGNDTALAADSLSSKLPLLCQFTGVAPVFAASMHDDKFNKYQKIFDREELNRWFASCVNGGLWLRPQAA
jgi:hypothetical protein